MIDSSIRAILCTRVGERVMRPDFGCRMWEALQGAVDDRALTSAAGAAREAIERWAPEAEVHDVVLRGEPDGAGETAGVHLDVTYADRETGERRYLYLAFPLDRTRSDVAVIARPDDARYRAWIGAAGPEAAP